MLKKVVLEYEFKILRISEDNVDKLIDKHEKISPNEKVAINEIFKATGTKDPRERARTNYPLSATAYALTSDQSQ